MRVYKSIADALIWECAEKCNMDEVAMRGGLTKETLLKLIQERESPANMSLETFFKLFPHATIDLRAGEENVERVRQSMKNRKPAKPSTEEALAEIDRRIEEKVGEILSQYRLPAVNSAPRSRKGYYVTHNSGSITALIERHDQPKVYDEIHLGQQAQG